MASARRGGRRRRRGNVEHENEERWLLTYADMITLLMALFMVLFSISSVNTSKFESLQRALNDAFSGRILPGGESLQQHGGSQTQQKSSPEPPIPSLQPLSQRPSKEAERKGFGTEDGRQEGEQLKELKHRIDEAVRRDGLQEKVETTITRRGLVIRLLTDKVLFDSGKAALKPRAKPLLTHVAGLLRVDEVHPVQVEGHTDNLPIANEVFPSNWELSTGRASSVVRFLLTEDLPGERIGAVGYAHEHPIASNDDERGRARNRRVEIVLLRIGKPGKLPAPEAPRQDRPEAAPGAGDSPPSADDPFEAIESGPWQPLPADDAKVNR